MADNVDKTPLILVVNGIVKELAEMEAKLTEANYRVVTTINGYEGYEIAVDQRPDLIMLADSAKRMSGAKLARLLKFDKKYDDIPIIAIVAGETATEEIQSEIQKLKINRYVTRPIDYKQLLLSIRNLFSESEIGGFIEEALL